MVDFGPGVEEQLGDVDIRAPTRLGERAVDFVRRKSGQRHHESDELDSIFQRRVDRPFQCVLEKLPVVGRVPVPTIEEEAEQPLVLDQADFVTDVLGIDRYPFEIKNSTNGSTCSTLALFDEMHRTSRGISSLRALRTLGLE